jgi:hypothetical protein
MQPEISHRCASCGAALREPAMFCPECGKPLAIAPESATESAPQPGAETPAVKTTSSVATEEARISTTPMVETAAASVDVGPDHKTDHSQKDPDSEPGSKPGARERARDRLHRAGSAASSVARHALDDNVKRVEKIHHVSTAIYEEAAYDPSLRFVLVALGLFIVFVILLVLSKVMG